jgi:hypothetical protein
MAASSAWATATKLAAINDAQPVFVHDFMG